MTFPLWRVTSSSLEGKGTVPQSGAQCCRQWLSAALQQHRFVSAWIAAVYLPPISGST